MRLCGVSHTNTAYALLVWYYLNLKTVLVDSKIVLQTTAKPNGTLTVSIIKMIDPHIEN